jgi:CheY-like chemotaxis protein
MPGISGDDLANQLRTLWSGDPPVLIAVTAMDSEAARERIRAAFDQHLVKPVDPRVLIGLLDARAEHHPPSGT